MTAPTIDTYLDIRRRKDNGTYPVKLKVYYNDKTKFYRTGIDLTREEFERSYLAQKPREEFKKVKQSIQKIETRANEVLETIKDFSFEKFERKMFRPIGSENDVFYYYKKVIDDFKRRERVNTQSNYELSQKSIKAFLASTGKNGSELQFDEITVSFLKDYESWMLRNEKSITTVGIYLRPLQAIFNHAIADTETLKEIYPFGKRKYQIPAGRNTKKALSKEELAKLRDFPVEPNIHLQKARDFWFFSFYCNGMNMRDIAELKYKDLRENSFSFIRTKTKFTTKGDLKPIYVALNPFTRNVLDKYRTHKVGKEDLYIFPIFNPRMNEEEKVRAVDNFTRFVNQHMKTIAKAVGVTEKLSTYWARHTFTTISITSNNRSLEFIQGALGHNSIATTMKYWSGFDESVVNDNAEQLMNF